MGFNAATMLNLVLANALRKRVSEDVIEIGQRLVEAKALAGHG
jgi:hypothetical protein